MIKKDTYLMYAADDIRKRHIGGAIIPSISNVFIDNNGYVCAPFINSAKGLEYRIIEQKIQLITSY